MLINLKANTFDELQTLYSWEISAPNEFGMYSSYVKLSENILFAYVNQSVLEPVFFRPRFRVRCTTQYLKSNLNYQEGNFMSKSHTVEILNYKTGKEYLCPKLLLDNNNNNNNKFETISKNNNLDNSWFILKDNNIMDHNIINDKKQFITKADYISAEFIKLNPSINIEYLNYIRLTINIPNIEGSIPLISTKQLNSYRHLLHTDSSSFDSSNFDHICSNFNVSNNNSIKYGFVNTNNANNFSSYYYKESLKYRNKKTVKFYNNLDNNKCRWEYVAYFDMSELTTHCHATILSDSDIRDENQNLEKSYLAIKIPLFVSYIFPSYQASWSTLEFKSQIDASIVYKTIPIDKSNTNNNIQDLSNGPMDNSIEELNLDLNPIQSFFTTRKFRTSLTSPHERLVVEFVTVPFFKGQFLPHFTHMVSSFNGPESLDLGEFDLELVWTQFLNDSPKQMWKATSKSFLNDYTGNYTASLIPCYSNQNATNNYPYICTPRSPLK